MRTSIWLLVFLHQILSCFLANPQNSPIRPKPVLVGAEAYCRIKAPNSQRNSTMKLVLQCFNGRVVRYTLMPLSFLAQTSMSIRAE